MLDSAAKLIEDLIWLKDSNDAIRIDSWFWSFIKKNLNYYTIEVYNLPFEEYKKQYKILEDFLHS